MDKDKKEDILRNYLDTISEQIKAKHGNTNHDGTPWSYHHQRKCLRQCFLYFLPKHHFINKYRLRQYLRNYRYSAWTIYDVCDMAPSLPWIQNSDNIIQTFVRKTSTLPISNHAYHKMAEIAKSFTTRNRYFYSLQKSNNKHHLIYIMLLTFIISLVIPNMPIDDFGDFLGSIGLHTVESILNFCINRIETFIDPALIGRILINLIIDIPVYYHYKQSQN